MPDPPTSRTVKALAIAAGATIVVLGLREISFLAAPALLAVIVDVLVYPVYSRLRGRGVPRALSFAAFLASAYGIVVALLAVVVFGVGRLARVLIEHRATFVEAVSDLRSALRHLGLSGDQAQSALAGITPGQALRLLTVAVPPFVSFAAGAVLFSGLLLFLVLESIDQDQRLGRLRAERPSLGRALSGFVSKTRRYFWVTALFALGVGALDSVFLALLGIPMPILWGLLAAVCNFIPYVGFVIGLVPPAVLALLEVDWQHAVFVVVVFVILNSLVTTLLPARIVGDTVGLSTYLTIFSLVFWGWVLGPLGSVLAVPASLLVKAILIDANPNTAWLAPLLNSKKDNRAAPR